MWLEGLTGFYTTISVVFNVAFCNEKLCHLVDEIKKFNCRNKKTPYYNLP